MVKKPGSGSGMNNPDHISESLETIFWVKILNTLMWICDGKKIWIRDKHPRFAKLPTIPLISPKQPGTG
jgi:hypothetical protein